MASREFQLGSLRLGDDPAAWRSLGFRVRDRTAGQTAVLRLGNTLIELTGSGSGFEGWHIDDLHTQGTPGSDQACTLEAISCVGAARGAELSEVPALHPNGVDGIDHVVVVTGDPDRTGGSLRAGGLECRGERTTGSYGSPMRQQFYWLGDVILELVGPSEPDSVSDREAAVFGLALVSADLDRTLAHLGPLASAPKEAVQPGRRIATLRGAPLGVSLPLVVMSPHPG